jgi:hypothetical protein
MYLTNAGASAPPSRRTSTDGPPAPTEIAVNAQCPSGVAATPTGAPGTGSIAVATVVSVPPVDPADVQPGDVSGCAVAVAVGPGAAVWAGLAGAVPGECAAAEVQPAHTATAADTIAVAPRAVARVSRMPDMLTPRPAVRRGRDGYSPHPPEPKPYYDGVNLAWPDGYHRRCAGTIRPGLVPLPGIAVTGFLED